MTMNIEERKRHDAVQAASRRSDSILIYAAILEINEAMKKQAEILEKILQQQKSKG